MLPNIETEPGGRIMFGILWKSRQCGPPKLNKLIEVMQIRGVRVFVHWSVLLIGALIILGAVEDAPLALTVLGSHYGVILLHECGHMVAAQRKGCSVRLHALPGYERGTCYLRVLQSEHDRH